MASHDLARIEGKLDRDIAGATPVSSLAGGIAFKSMSEVMEFSKLMSLSDIAVPKHLRGNPGACMAIVIQAIEWRLSPYAVGNKSYSVNDRLAYESQLIQAVILQRAPITGRFKVKFKGEGEARVCRVWAELKDGKEIVEYESPPFGRITPKNSPLWKSDPDQQQFYYSGRALCRRHFPDVLLGIYARDELDDGNGPDNARDITPQAAQRATLGERLDALANIAPAAPEYDQGTEESLPADESNAAPELELAAPEASDSLPPELDRIRIAKQRGDDAFHAGHQRRGMPGEYRSPVRRAEAEAWWDGFDAAAKEAADEQR